MIIVETAGGKLQGQLSCGKEQECSAVFLTGMAFPTRAWSFCALLSNHFHCVAVLLLVKIEYVENMNNSYLKATG